MLPELDIWRAAQAMVKWFGADAMLEAAARADQLLEDGDMAGAATWHRIILGALERSRRRCRVASKTKNGPVSL